MKFRGISTIFLSFLTVVAFAQEKPGANGWTLEQCVNYALENNISIKQADVQARIDKLTLDQSKMALFPNVNSQHSLGAQFGRSVDRTSNQFATGTRLFASHGINTDVDVFNWYSKRNTIEANKFLYAASGARFEKAKNDIALNVANAYLAALLNKEQIRVAQVQLNQSREQVENINKQVQAGALPELNLAEMQTQFASDSATVITAKSNYELSLLQLKALLNLDAAEPFDIATPPVHLIPVEPLADLDPVLVYASAVENLPQQKINEFNIKAAEKNVAVARAGLYPRIAAFAGLSTNYSNYKMPNYQMAEVPIGYTRGANGVFNDTVYARMNILAPGFTRPGYFTQAWDNLGQNIGVSLNIPIFSGGSARTAWKKAQLNVESQRLQKEQDSRTLKQDIYQAHTNAIAALEKFNASKIALESADKAYDFAKKRFEVGLLKPLDLITNQNNFFRARINALSAQYDYVFKMKLLEFYKGKGLKL